MEKIKLLEDKFKNPPAVNRSIPFWAWNGKLSVEELSYQINEMKDKGMGGFFMHSREGLETEYLGEEWLNCVKGAVDTAREKGMKAWLYDEDRFPSGGAGGNVCRNGGDKYRAKALTLEIAKGGYYDSDNVLAVFMAVVNEDAISSCRKICMRDRNNAGEGEVALIFRIEVSGPCEWFNNEAPVDNLNPEAVSEFINLTHEVYRRHFGCEFGSTIPGVFTDEPSIADFHSVYKNGISWIPWTQAFDRYFKEKRGYDILQNLPYIFFKGEESAKVRHDYWRTISDRFCESYSKQLGDWCERNKLAYTGHYLAEHNLGIAARVSGSIMPHYRYQQIPGIDLLTEQTEEYLTIKQCTSVANQYGKPFVISEMYGCSGWDFTFEGQKWVGDWQFVMGVNLRCQHLSLYSLKGCRKRDYPPVFNYNTTWWKYNNVVEDYFSRISTVLSEGNAVRDVLVIHPSSTVWSMLGAYPYSYKEWEDPSLLEINRYQERFDGFMRILLGAHYDFDLGDETIIEEKGRIEGDKFIINNIEYSIVVLPSVITLFENTMKLLLDFMSAGGKVISIKPLVSMVDGIVSDKVYDLAGHRNMYAISEEEDLCPLLEKLLPRRVGIYNNSMIQAEEFLYLLKESPDYNALFIVNNDRNNSYEVMVSLSVAGSVEEWDPLNGEIRETNVIMKNGRLCFWTGFGPAGSKLYVINRNKEPKYGDFRFSFNRFCNRMVYTALDPVCRFTRTSPNVLLLDECKFRVGSGEWSEKMYVWQAQSEIRAILGMRQVYYNGIPQRYRWVNEPHLKDGTFIELRFAFNVEDIPSKDVYAVVEEVRNFKIVLNNKEIANTTDGWFMDRSFDKVKLKGLAKGVNELVLSCDYKNSHEIEDCYIIGDFGVDIDRNIIDEHDAIHIGDWCMQGYYHYAGSIIYHYDFEYRLSSNNRIFLELGRYSAVTIEVRVNDNIAGQIPWRCSNSLDISAYLRKGINKIDIEVMGSARNIFGPFHQDGTQNPWVDWEFFKRPDSRNKPYYVVKPYGLMEQASIYMEQIIVK